MDILQGLQGMLGQALGGQGQAGVSNGAKAGGNDLLSNLLSPAVIGGLVGALFSGKGTAGNMLKGALLGGGGKMLWDKLTKQVDSANTQNPQYDGSVAPVDKQAERLITALVFAAKSDGHIDEQEQKAIQSQVEKLNLGPSAQQMVQQAIKAPLDPQIIARGVTNSDEALRLYALSSAVVNVDSFMERNYLDALANSLNIPANVKDEVDSQLKTQ